MIPTTELEKEISTPEKNNQLVDFVRLLMSIVVVGLHLDIDSELPFFYRDYIK